MYKPLSDALRCLALALPLCCLLALGGPGPVLAQESKPPLTGFTRPGTPDDEQRDGKVIAAADDPDLRKTALGGTIYFRVIERGPDGWGEGKEFHKLFQAGIDGGGVSSPTFDATAKYLYLYQIVNDRHTATPLQSVSVKLIVDVKDITSWGYFSGVGFATLAAKKGQPQSVVQPVAFNHVLQNTHLDVLYRRRAPAVSLQEPLRLALVPTVRGEGNPLDKQKKPIAIVWDALDPALNPDHVMLLATSDFDKKPAFRAVWNAANALPRDGRSTVFGFTSNLPPTLEPVRLRGFRKPEHPIQPAGEAEADRKIRLATLVAEGRVPTPRPEFPVAEADANLPGNFTAPPGGTPALASPGGGSSGFPVPVAGGGGSSGGSAGLSGGGGGTAGGSSGTQGVTGSQTSQQQNNQPQQTINFNPTLLNAQSQSQQQRQLQQQLQLQLQQQQQPQTNSNPPPAVVPQPMAWLLALLGLPALLCLRRNRRVEWKPAVGKLLGEQGA